jgi:hypothetical protein
MYKYKEYDAYILAVLMSQIHERMDTTILESGVVNLVTYSLKKGIENLVTEEKLLR